MRPGNRRGAHFFWRRGTTAVKFPVIPCSKRILKAKALILLGSEKFFRENSLIFPVIPC
jgi:hypothetical protein